jgi:hypothetical protein
MTFDFNEDDVKEEKKEEDLRLRRWSLTKKNANHTYISDVKFV